MPTGAEGLCPLCKEAVQNTVQLVVNLGKALVGDESSVRDQTVREIHKIVDTRMEQLAELLREHKHHSRAIDVIAVSTAIVYNNCTVESQKDRLLALST